MKTTWQGLFPAIPLHFLHRGAQMKPNVSQVDKRD